MKHAAQMLGLTIQRWARQEDDDDRRRGPVAAPANKLTPTEREEVLSVVNSQRIRELSPKQIVPHLADEGRYVASESSFYRISAAGEATGASGTLPTGHASPPP